MPAEDGLRLENANDVVYLASGTLGRLFQMCSQYR
jgi:hypothetical protein